MRALITGLLVLVSQFAQATPGRSLMSVVTITKRASTDRFVFAICQATQCERVGSDSGYTSAQLDSFNGGLQQVGAVALGAGEGLVMLYASGTGIAIGVGYASNVLLFGGAISGIVIPATAIHYMKSVNPFEKFHNGRMKSTLEQSVDRLVASGRASVVVYQSTDLAETMAFAARAETVLNQLR